PVLSGTVSPAFLLAPRIWHSQLSGNFEPWPPTLTLFSQTVLMPVINDRISSAVRESVRLDGWILPARDEPSTIQFPRRLMNDWSISRAFTVVFLLAQTSFQLSIESGARYASGPLEESGGTFLTLTPGGTRTRRSLASLRESVKASWEIAVFMVKRVNLGGQAVDTAVS